MAVSTDSQGTPVCWSLLKGSPQKDPALAIPEVWEKVGREHDSARHEMKTSGCFID